MSLICQPTSEDIKHHFNIINEQFKRRDQRANKMMVIVLFFLSRITEFADCEGHTLKMHRGKKKMRYASRSMRLHPYLCGPHWKRPDNAGPHAEDLGHSKRMTGFVVCDADGKGINYMQIRGDNNEARRIICLLSAVSQLHRPLPSRSTQCSFNQFLPPTPHPFLSPLPPPVPSSIIFNV